MTRQKSGFDVHLERRLHLASQPENMGDDLTARDHLWLVVVTLLVPAVLMLAGWYL